MSKIEFISPEGFRLDGRRRDELRQLQCRIGGLSSRADGTAMVQMGCTKVVSYVYGPFESHRSHNVLDKADIDCNVIAAPFSTPTRIARRWGEKNSIARSLIIRQIFESVILVEKHPKSTITINVYILEDDGGVIPAAINATTLALIDACIPMRDIITASNVALLGNGAPLVDLNSIESSAATAELNLAISHRSGSMVALDLDSKVQWEKYSEIENAGVAACQEIATILKHAVLEHARNLVI